MGYRVLKYKVLDMKSDNSRPMLCDPKMGLLRKIQNTSVL